MSNPPSDPEIRLPRPRRKRKKRIKQESQTTVWTKIAQRFSEQMLLVAERARGTSVGWLVFVLVLTSSLAADAIFRAGFIPGLFNGLTFLNFMVHEFGHLACSMLPTWIHVAAGTFVQLSLPFGAVFMFAKQHDDAAACFAVSWLAISMVHTADYMADARMQQGDMTLSAGFWSLTSGQQVRPSEMIHDWNYLFDALGVLSWDQTIAGSVHFLAGSIALMAVALNLFMIWSATSEFKTKRC